MQVVLQKQIKLPHEIACVDIHPLDSERHASYCVVGLWVDVCLHVLSLPNLVSLLLTYHCIQKLR